MGPISGRQEGMFDPGPRRLRPRAGPRPGQQQTLDRVKHAAAALPRIECHSGGVGTSSRASNADNTGFMDSSSVSLLPVTFSRIACSSSVDLEAIPKEIYDR